MSEYLAVNMLNANTSISLKEFPESADTDYLLDAWEEAVYQNPMVLGVTGASIANGGKTLHVKYDTKSEEIKKKQKEISKEAERVVDSIITDDMTELEKEMASINICAILLNTIWTRLKMQKKTILPESMQSLMIPLHRMAFC